MLCSIREVFLFIYCSTYTFSIFCTFNHSNAFKMKNDNRVCRSGGIRRIFDKPPPRLLKMSSFNFFSSGAIIVFRFLCSLSSFSTCLADKVTQAVSFSIILNHMLFVKFSLLKITLSYSFCDKLPKCKMKNASMIV